MGETQEPHNLALGRAIHRLRIGARLTQQQLADRAGMSVEELGLIEAGKVEASWGTLRHLASGLQVALADVFRLTEELGGSGEQ
jgi:transcriptional regulator with XRE-family HTH domain